VESREIAPSNRSGLQVALDIIIAPKAAFESLREVPTWGWAVLIAAVLAIIGSLVSGPAFVHALSIEMPPKFAQQYANLPADQREAATARAMAAVTAFSKFAFIFVLIAIPITGLIQAVVMLIANAIGKGDGSFKKFWALSINVSIVGIGLSSIVIMIIVLVRGADTFNSSADIAGSIPSLAMLAPGADKVLTRFLAAFNVFNLWAAALLVIGMSIVARIPRGVAIGAATFMIVCAAAFAAFGQG